MSLIPISRQINQVPTIVDPEMVNALCLAYKMDYKVNIVSKSRVQKKVNYQQVQLLSLDVKLPILILPLGIKIEKGTYKVVKHLSMTRAVQTLSNF